MDDLTKRVNEICSLKKGWLDRNGDGEEVIIDPDFVIKVVAALITAGISKPAINPSPDGYIVLEWDNSRTIVIEPSLDEYNKQEERLKNPS